MVTIKSQVTPAGGGAPDSGYDYRYTSLNSWELARRRNLVSATSLEIVEVFSGGSAATSILDFGSWVTDANYYVEVRAASGHEHPGYWSTGKAYVEFAPGDFIYGSTKHVKITRMQISGSNYSGLFYNIWMVDGCYIKYDNTDGAGRYGAVVYTTIPTTLQNSIVVATGTNIYQMIRHMGAGGGGTGTSYVYNCTLIDNCSTGGYALFSSHGGTVVSQNNYLKAPSGGLCFGVDPGFGNPSVLGSNDATSTTEAPTALLKSIAYSTSNFQNVTSGSENLRLVVSSSNKLLDNGANLTSSGVTTDVIGTARPQFGAFDIGGFENDIPLCWNYTAKYRNSNKLFKASGCGSFPKSLHIPSNIDTSTGRMVDDGILINPDEYRII